MRGSFMTMIATSRRVALLALGAPTIVLAQRPFDPARVTPRSDSFVVTLQGRAVGGVRETLERTADGYRLVSVQGLAGMSQTTEVTFTRALDMRAVKQSGQVRGQPMSIEVTYGGGRAKGAATTPDQQGALKTTVVDTVVPAGAVDDNALQSLLHSLPLAAGKTFTIPVFASGQGAAKPMAVAVTGEEQVTVPAGSFDSWKVTVTGGAIPVTFWIAKAVPRVVKLGFAGAPMAFELVK